MAAPAVLAVRPATIRNFSELREQARRLGPKRVVVANADDEVALTAAAAALQAGIARPLLVGDIRNIRRRAEVLSLNSLLARAEFIEDDGRGSSAARLAGTGKADILMKGHLRTDELLRAVLAKDSGLCTGRLLSDVLLYEDALAGERRLVGITDGGLNVAPTLPQKKEIVRNAVAVMHSLGVCRPKLAIMSATEVVSESVPSTVDAALLTQMGAAGEFGQAEVFGPLALDNALLDSAARVKNIQSRVAGHADCMIVPNIEAGNLLGKAVKYLGGSQCAHVVVGARVPILIPSRVESAEDKLNAIALGVVFAGR